MSVGFARREPDEEVSTRWTSGQRDDQLASRNEAASRFVEGGWPLHHVQEMLGHSNLKQTSTYVNAKAIHSHVSAKCQPLMRSVWCGVRG